MEQQRYPRNTALDQRLDDAAARLRKEDRGTPLERESFIRRPRKTGTSPQIWKTEDDSMLRGMMLLGASALRIAAALNRDVDTVRARALFLGSNLPSDSDQRRLLLEQYSLTGRVH